MTIFCFTSFIHSDWRVMQPDIDHIHPKSLLTARGVGYEQIYCIENYQLISVGVNRGDKNNKPLATWVDIYIKEGKKIDATSEEEYRKKHLIPPHEYWEFEQYATFLEKRGELIIDRVKAAIPAAQATPKTPQTPIAIGDDSSVTSRPVDPNKLMRAKQCNVEKEFVDLHNTVYDAHMWATNLKHAVQYHHNYSGTRVLLTIYIDNNTILAQALLREIPRIL